MSHFEQMENCIRRLRSSGFSCEQESQLPGVQSHIRHDLTMAGVGAVSALADEGCGVQKLKGQAACALLGCK